MGVPGSEAEATGMDEPAGLKRAMQDKGQRQNAGMCVALGVFSLTIKELGSF